MWRRLRISDFKDKFSVVHAKYDGKNKYLTPGKMYYVTFNEKSGRATVQQSYNPGMNSNGGIQFPVNTFLIEEESEMINFADLTPEDQDMLLQQARAMIDEENIQKDAITVYKIKRKELTEKCLNEIYKTYNMRYDCDQRGVKSRYVSLTNYLLRLSVLGKQNANSPSNIIISKPAEWDKFVKISEAVKKVFIDAKEM